MTAAAINPSGCAWCGGVVDHLREPVAMTVEGPMHRLCALEQEVSRLRKQLDESEQDESLARTGERKTPRGTIVQRRWNDPA
jgi:hypothetical protein